MLGVEVGVMSLASFEDFLGRGVWKGDTRPGEGGLFMCNVLDQSIIIRL